MSKPIIGISGSVLDIEEGPFTGARRAYVNEDYVKAVAKSNGVPVIIPMTEDKEIIDIQLNGIDALLLSGGHDVDPGQYNEASKSKLGDTLPERDRFDRLLIEGAIERGIPVLGICRGHQILNVTLGGTLYQDLDYIENCDRKHDQFENAEPESHKIFIEKQSVLNDIFGDATDVNSFHHLAIKDIAPGFKATALSEDGVVEGIEHVGYPFVIGVQWHPEALASFGGEGMQNLFKKFISSAKENIESQRYALAI